MKSTSGAAAFLLVLAVGAAAASAGTGVGLWTSYVVPGAAHLPGDAGTFWRTDVAVVNPYPYQAVTVRVAYLPEKTDNSSWTFRAYTVGPGAQLVLDDVVGSVFGQEGKGSLCVWSPDGLYFTVSARTYTGAAGTFGQTINGQQSVNFGEAQSYTAGVRNAAGYRTNVGVFNWSAAALEVRADVFDDEGVLAGSRTFSLKPWSSEQVGVGTFAGSAASGYVRWTGLTAGDSAQWLAYASVVDDTTGDAVFVEDRGDDVYTQHEPAYDLSGRWYGNVSTALGSAPGYAAITEDGAHVTVHLYDSASGGQVAFLDGYEDGGVLQLAGYSTNYGDLGDEIRCSAQVGSGGESLTGTFSGTGLFAYGGSFTVSRVTSAPKVGGASASAPPATPGWRGRLDARAVPVR